MLLPAKRLQIFQREGVLFAEDTFVNIERLTLDIGKETES